MRFQLNKSLIFSGMVFGWLTLGAWNGGPAPESKSDSLAIVRVVKPVNELFNIKSVMFVSKGSGKIDQVEVTDAEQGNGELVLKQTLTDFLRNGYTLQSSTESVGNGMRLNTYYLKKKVI